MMAPECPFAKASGLTMVNVRLLIYYLSFLARKNSIMFWLFRAKNRVVRKSWDLTYYYAPLQTFWRGAHGSLLHDPTRPLQHEPDLGNISFVAATPPGGDHYASEAGCGCDGV